MNLLHQLCADVVLSQAYTWLTHRRKHHPPGSDIWKLRRRWPTEKTRLQRLILEGSYSLEPQIRYYLRRAEETVDIWRARDALVLKGVSLVLAQRLAASLPTRCFHFPGGRGVRAALREVVRALPDHSFVFRTDVRGYYDSIQPMQVMEQLAALVGPDPILCLVWQYMDWIVEKNAYLFEVRHGISRGCPLSSLIGTLFLSPVDQHFSNTDLFYLRYMDDILVLAPTRWKLRTAVRTIHQAVSAQQLTLHPDKTFVGRIEHGFDWLGFRVSPKGLAPSEESIRRCIEGACPAL